MRHGHIRAILFDFGGVFADEGFYHALRELGREQRLAVKDMPAAGMQAVYETGYVLGHGDEHAFWERLRQRTGLKGRDEDLTKRVLQGFRVRPGMRQLVRELRQRGYLVGLLSDQTDWLDRLDAEQHFYREFDALYISHRLGKGKRDPSLYDDVARDLGMEPGAILFIDDNPDNVARARRRGWQAVRFIDEAQLRRELIRRGLLDSATP